ncbi:hypothetical protein [Variovorax sp.]|jgi:hypothetical protein|uniref:hypothetical protein n=1 Tax=Variovorax sp. TaxID=1871043 RepID=UPI0037D9AF2F
MKPPLESENCPRLGTVLIVGLVCFLVSCAAPAPGTPVKDVFGVMSIVPAEGFSDSSPQYRVQVSGAKIPRDQGIQSLLMLTTQGNKQICKFREFRYRATEAGYRWNERQIAEGVADHFSSSIKGTSVTDFLSAGIPNPAFSPKMNRVAAVSNAQVTLGAYSGWQSTRDHWVEKDGQAAESTVARSTTVALRIPSLKGPGAPIHYVVAECSVSNHRAKVEADMAGINAMLQTIELHRPSL